MELATAVMNGLQYTPPEGETQNESTSGRKRRQTDRNHPSEKRAHSITPERLENLHTEENVQEITAEDNLFNSIFQQITDSMDFTVDTPLKRLKTFRRQCLPLFQQQVNIALGDAMTSPETPIDSAASLMWEQANIATQFWHLVNNIQRLENLLSPAEQ